MSCIVRASFGNSQFSMEVRTRFVRKVINVTASGVLAVLATFPFIIFHETRFTVISIESAHTQKGLKVPLPRSQYTCILYFENLVSHLYIICRIICDVIIILFQRIRPFRIRLHVPNGLRFF